MDPGGGSVPNTLPKVYMGGEWIPPTLVRQTGSSAIEIAKGAIRADKSQVPVGKPGTDWIRDPQTGKYYQLVDQQNVINMFFQFNQATKDDFRMKLGLTGNSNAVLMNDADLFARWAAYVKLASQYAAGGKAVTPWQLLNNDIASAERARNAPPKVTESTTTRTDLTSLPDAEGIFYESARQLIGRAPTAEEIKIFHGRLNKTEADNPIVQKVRTTTTGAGDVTEEVVSQTGGLDSGARQLAAQREAQANPEYGAYQASTTYMNAFRELIFGRGY